LSADPEDLIAHAGLAEAHREVQDLPRSIWHMERAFEIQPYNRAVQLELRTLYEQRDGIVPEQVSLTRAALARLYVRGGHYRLAADELQLLLTDQSDRVDLRVLLAEALFWDGRRLEAARVCADILDELSDCIKANAILAEVWLSGGREPEARPFIEHLWALTLIDRSQRDTETLVGHALSYGEHAPPEQILVEQLEYVHTAVEEPVVNWEGESAFAAVAVQELPGWLDELDDEPVALAESEADSTVVGETDWSDQLSGEQEIIEPLETTTQGTLAEMEDAGADFRDTRFEEAMPEFSAPEVAEDQELPGQAESIGVVTALLLESEADDDTVLPSDKDMTDGLRDETAGEDEPAEALMGEFNATREEAQTRDPEQPIDASFSEDAAAEDFEMEGLWQAADDQVEDAALTPQDAVPLESEHSPEDLFLESIVAEAFGEMTPLEPPESEPADFAVDEEGKSAYDSGYPQDDIFLEEIAAEAFEEEIAPEPAESFSDLAPREATPGPVGPIEEPIPEERAMEAIDEETLPVSDDEGRGSTDLLFAALSARQIQGHQREELQEESEAVDAGEVEQQEQADIFEQEPEQLADQFEIDPAETSLEDDIFESLAAEVAGDDALGSPQTGSEYAQEAEIPEAQAPEADYAVEYLDPGDKVTKEFDVAPEEIVPPFSEARPEAAVLGELAADAIDEDAFREPAEEIEESPDAAPGTAVASEYEIRQRDDSFESWAVDVSDEDGVPEDDSFEPDAAEATGEVVSLEPSDVVTKEFDVLPDALHDPSEFVAGDSASAEESITETAPESQIQDVEIKESDLPPVETPPDKLPGRDMLVELPEIETAAAFPPVESFDSTEVFGDDSVSDWLDDLSEETTDVENLPDWLYDAIGFTGELEMPDDYEDPDWLGELGADMEETVRESKPKASADEAQHHGNDAQDTSHGVSEAPIVDEAGIRTEREIPDWLEGAGDSLEELPTDLVENMGISGSDAGDEDEGALSWLEELAAEPSSLGDEKGAGKSGVLDRFIRKRPGQPDEPADGAGADSD
jgi:hypothetical protein